MNIVKVVLEVVAILTALISIVERKGEGDEKRGEVIDLFMDKGKEHLSLPKWAADLFLRRTFVGWLVDVLVWAMNTYGPFGEDENSSGEQSNEPSTASA